MEIEKSFEIKIVPIDLGNNLDLPSSHLCMVMVQPFLKLQQTKNGFKIDRSILATHKKIILSTVDLTRDLQFENTPFNANFILFPELSLPFDMISEIKSKVLSSFPINSILMGGIEGINIGEYHVLLESSDNPHDARLNLYESSNYINCGIILVKNKKDEVKMYLQPKIKACEDEQAMGMVEGKHIFLFRTTNYNFLCLICFDFIGRNTTSPNTLVKDIMDELSSNVESGYALNLDLVYILQYNKNTFHRSFQDSARIFLHEGMGKIETRSIFFVNTAAEYYGNSKQYGKSALYFPRGTWMIPSKGRYPVNHTFALEKTEYACERARFREDGPCIHSIVYIPRKALSGDSGDIRYPLVPPPLCYKINTDGSLEQGRAVPALEKIVSDNLPLNLATVDNRWNSPSDISLRNAVEQKYKEAREILINVRLERMKEVINLLLLSHYDNNRTENPDFWKTDNEGEAIKEMASTLSVLALYGETNIDLPNKLLTGFLKEKFYIVIIDGKGTEAPSLLQNDYKEYVERSPYINEIDIEKNTLLVYCRHRGEQPPNGVAQEIVGFTLISKSEDLAMPLELQDENKFTSLGGSRVFWHSRESLHGILVENSLTEARKKLEEKLEPLAN